MAHRRDPYLLAELLLTELVERVELLGQDDVLDETTSRELHTDDDGSVRHHHGHGTEVDLQILRQFLTTGITWVLQGE